MALCSSRIVSESSTIDVPATEAAELNEDSRDPLFGVVSWSGLTGGDHVLAEIFWLQFLHRNRGTYFRVYAA